MSVIGSLRIARTALQAERLRMDVVANNLANVNSTRTEAGGPYRRQTVLFAASDDSPTSFAAVMARRSGGAVQGGVRVDGVIEDPKPPRRVYEPNNPDADADGFVLYPDIDVTTEMTDLISANRAYQANVTALNALKSMAQKALEIGR